MCSQGKQHEPHKETRVNTGVHKGKQLLSLIRYASIGVKTQCIIISPSVEAPRADSGQGLIQNLIRILPCITIVILSEISLGDKFSELF